MTSGLVDATVGLVRPPWVVEARRGDPSVFVASTETADLRTYGIPELDDVADDGRIAGSGAGLTTLAAEGAAIGECLERYALALNPTADRLAFGSYRDLRSSEPAPVAPDEWALFTPGQAETIPYSIFDENTPLAWTPAENLLTGIRQLVPACLVWLPYVHQFEDEAVIAPPVSTGTACETSSEKATVRAICELIERDAFMITWRNRLPCCAVSLDDASELADLFGERFAHPALAYSLYVTTLDLGVPSFLGVLRDNRGSQRGTIVAGAASLDPLWAATKTLLELVQGLAWMEHVGPVSLDVADFASVTTFEQRAMLYAFNDLRRALDFLDDGRPPVSLPQIASHATGSPTQDLDWCIGMLADRGLRAFAIDLTPPEIGSCGYSIVRVLIPALEVMEGDHRYPFLGGRRWQDVPVACGLREHPISTDEMNPYPHPYP